MEKSIKKLNCLIIFIFVALLIAGSVDAQTAGDAWTPNTPCPKGYRCAIWSAGPSVDGVSVQFYNLYGHEIIFHRTLVYCQTRNEYCVIPEGEIPTGDVVFFVKAINQYGKESKESIPVKLEKYNQVVIDSGAGSEASVP
jgi:hypothetical protein